MDDPELDDSSNPLLQQLPGYWQSLDEIMEDTIQEGDHHYISRLSLPTQYYNTTQQHLLSQLHMSCMISPILSISHKL